MVAGRGPPSEAQEKPTLVAGRGVASVHYLFLATESPEDNCHMFFTYKPHVLVLPSQIAQQHTGVG